MKTKKIAERVKKIRPGRNVKKAMKPLFKKKVPGTAKETVGGKDLNISKRKRAESQREAALAAERASKEPEAIKHSEDEAREYAENIFDTVREPLIALDHNLRVVKVSRSFYDFFKVKPADTVGKLIYDLGNKQWDIPKLRELLETILPKKATFDNYEVEHDFATIGRRVMLLNARQIQQALGKERIILLAIEDITKRKQTEQALKESEEKYHLLIENYGEGLGVVDLDECFVFANPAAERIFGVPPGSLKGRNYKDFVSAEQIAIILQETKKRLMGMESIYEIDFITANGEQRCSLVTATPQFNDEGIVIGTYGIFRDITERKQIEQALKKSEEKYRNLVESISDVIYEIDSQGVIVYASPVVKDVLGYDPAEVIGKNIMELIYLDDRSHLIERFSELREGIEYPLEYRFISKSGDIIWARTRTMPIMEDGRFTGARGTIIDITERKQAEFQREAALEALQKSHDELDCRVQERTAALAQANEILQADIIERKQVEEKIKNSLVEKEVLLKEVHHRVKNNLMIIIGLIKMQEAKVDNEMFNPLLQQLEGRIRSMALVHEGLYKSADLAHVNLQNYIEMMSGQIHAQFGANRDIRFSVQAAGVDVNLDSAVPCGLILNELLTNAFKHAFPGDKPRAGEVNCEIKVIVNQEGGMNVLTVADNGVGLPANLDWEKSETLGLRLIKMLSQQINGSIELDRTHGTIFRLRFAQSSTAS